MTAPTLFASGDDPEGTTTGAAQEAERHVPPHADARSTSLYRKYRPISFSADDLVGQEHIVRTLQNAIALDRVAHAYLFSGPRGTGKTTTARLLAKAVNCLDPDPANRPCNACRNCEAINSGSTPDIIEIDAASNRGIDDIRDLRERIRYAPAQLSSKVYIIDEAHQITGAAANAFLKTLEEPPGHSRFILATTDPEELLATIVSRCQRFEFRRISADDMARRLRVVSDLEGIRISDDALRVIGRHATGSLRDALGLLEQLALLAPSTEDETHQIDVAQVSAALGLSRNDRIEALTSALSRRSAAEALRLVQDALDEGDDPRQLNRQLVSYLRLLLLERAGGAPEADQTARDLANAFSLAELAKLARLFGEIDFNIKHAPFPQLPLELAIVEATTAPADAPLAEPRHAAASEPVSDATPRPTSLRDRVRNPAQPREAMRREAPAPVTSDPTPITPIRPEPAHESPAHQPAPTGGTSDEVERIAELWPRVRADVKALNRRMEALLSEVDPIAVSGNQITLAVPYPFHRDKLNSDDVRETVSGVLSRLLERDVSTRCVLRGEAAPSPPASRPAAAQPPTASTVDAVDEERDQNRLRAARNIFDAEEIEEIAQRAVNGDSSR